MLSGDELDTLIDRHQATMVPFCDRTTVIDAIMAQATRTPNAVAMTGPDAATVTYGQLADRTRAGTAYVPIDPGYPAERIRFLLQDSDAKVVVTDGAGVGSAATIAAGSWELGAVPADLPAPQATDAAYVIYTAGSTGAPKGVVVEHSSVINRLAWMQRRYPIGADDVILQKTPISFDVSVWELFWWAIEGAKVALLAPGAERTRARSCGR